MHFYRNCWFDPFEEQFISPFLSDCPSLMLWIAIHCIQHSQAMLERGVCELAHSFFHFIFSDIRKDLFETFVTLLLHIWKKCEIRCRVNHSALLHCQYRVGILLLWEGTEAQLWNFLLYVNLKSDSIIHSSGLLHSEEWMKESDFNHQMIL